MAIRIEILPAGKTIRVQEKTLLSDALEQSGLSPALYCRGRGVCGTCFVEILEGALPDWRPGERDLLERLGLSNRHRQACRFVLESNIRLRIPDRALPARVSVVEFGPEEYLALDPIVKKFALPWPSASPEQADSLQDNLRGRLGAYGLDVPLDVLRRWPETLKRAEGLLTAVVGADEVILDVEPGDSTGRVLGLAYDIGTTTVAAALVNLVSGHILARETRLNSQASYGADIVSRIGLVMEKPGRAENLRKAVLSDMENLTRNLLSSTGTEQADVRAASIAGNPVMNHLLLGLPVDTLAVAPFNAVFTSLSLLSPAEAGLFFLHPRSVVYFAPNIRSYVGGDTSAGLAASGFLQQKGPALYLDLGTNGEVVLKTGRKVTAASTAAGPAFEGMNISCGMLAAAGAVHKVEATADGFRIRTVDEAPARGLCGSGLIDLAAACLDKGLISPQGMITLPGKTIPVARGVTLVQKDVRELQLAVGAVRTGTRMMLEAHGLRARDLKAVFVAGAFGSSLSTANSVKLGLLPDVPAARFRFLGNASLSGAAAFLLSSRARHAAEETARTVEHFALASHPGFQDAYLSSLVFSKWS